MSYRWHRQSIAETFERIAGGAAPWVAMGDFLDDWRRSLPEDRVSLVTDSLDIRSLTPTTERWAAFCAATVDWLCWSDELPTPVWTTRGTIRLAEPWFLYPGDLLRAWQLATTPAPFKMRNIFGGDRMLDRA